MNHKNKNNEIKNECGSEKCIDCLNVYRCTKKRNVRRSKNMEFSTSWEDIIKMNIKLETNRYILKGTRKWHDFMHSNISVPVFLMFFVLMFMFVMMITIVFDNGVAW